MGPNENPSFYLYNHGISPKLLTLGTLVYDNYAEPEIRSVTFPDLSDSDFAELQKQNHIISQTVSGCFTATKETSFGLGIEALDLATIEYELAKKRKKLVLAKKGRRVILGNNDSVGAFFEKVIQNEAVRKRLTRWLTVAKSKWVFYAATFQKPRVYCVTGFYKLGEVVAKIEYSQTRSGTVGVSSAIIGATTGVPIGGKIGPFKDGRMLDANVVMSEDNVWAARFHQLKIEYVQIATAGTTELPSAIVLYEDCTHPREGLMKDAPMVKDTKTVEAPQDIKVANGVRVVTNLEEIEEIPEDHDPEDKYWSAFDVAEKRLKRADGDDDEEEGEVEADDDESDVDDD